MVTKNDLLNAWRVAQTEVHAAIWIGVGFAGVRLSFARNWRDVLLAGGLAAIDVGNSFVVDAAAKRYHAKVAGHDALVGELDQQMGREAATDDEVADLAEAIEATTAALEEVSAAIALREMLAFDIAVVSRVATEHALEGYRRAINENRVRHVGGPFAEV